MEYKDFSHSGRNAQPGDGDVSYREIFDESAGGSNEQADGGARAASDTGSAVPDEPYNFSASSEEDASAEDTSAEDASGMGGTPVGEGPGPRRKNWLPTLHARVGVRKLVLAGVGSLLAVAVIGLAGFGAVSLGRGGSLHSASSAASSSTSTAALQVQNTAVTSTSTAQQVYNKVKDSIVTIESYTSNSVSPSSEGSGIVMSADGYIITNEHVIDGASSVQVVLANNKKYTAKVVGSDTRTDLAVLKIGATGLTAATFGNSDQVTAAESVLAIGNPGGIEFSGSVTSGIVSAANRTLTTESGYTETFIQTDAAINPGNSGGALVNMEGQVIGITSSKISATGYEGMGFAIPINTAQPVVNDIIQYGYVTGRVKLGVSVTAIDSDRASAFGYPAGLLVRSVESGSSAATQGIQAGDIITQADGTAVTTFDGLYQIESKHKSGETMQLTVYRTSTGKTLTVTVKLAEDKGTTTSSSSSSSSSSSRQSGSYGYGSGSSDNSSNYGLAG